MSMRKIFIEIDGPSGFPNVYVGDLGVQLHKCQLLSVVNIHKISIDNEYRNELVSNKDLRSDQMYLRDMILTIDAGNVSESLARRSPGKLGYACWLTTGNRILRTYLSHMKHRRPILLLCVHIFYVFMRYSGSAKKLRCQTHLSFFLI